MEEFYKIAKAIRVVYNNGFQKSQNNKAIDNTMLHNV